MAKQVETQDLMTVETVHILNNDFNMYGTIDKPIFLAQDIAAMIEYSPDKVDQMLANVDDDEKLTDTIYRSGQKREMWFLTENGLYELLMQSRKPLAKAFKAEIKKILHQMRTGMLCERSGRFNMITNGNDKVIAVDDTQFIFATNFSGDPENDRYQDTRRKANIIISDPNQIQKLIDCGVNVRSTRPKDDDVENFEPEHFVTIQLKYRNRDGSPVKFPPKVYLVSGGKPPRLLDEEAVECIDHMYVQNVNVILNVYNYDPDNNKSSLQIRTMYVEQRLDDDPYASRYASQIDTEYTDEEDEDGDLPF